MEELKSYVKNTTETLNAHMGLQNSWCFLKASPNFVKYLTEVSEIFALKAHMKLMQKVKKQNGKEFIHIFSEKA